MGKVTVIFESGSVLDDVPEVCSWEVEETYMPAFVGAIAAHPKHGQKAVQIMADTGQRDADGDPILGPATKIEANTFREGLQSWAALNVRDPIISGVNAFIFAQKKAEKDAELAAEFQPIQPK